MWRRVLLLWLAATPALAAATMTEVNYLDQDPGEPAYHTRILVTPNYLRMDDGKHGTDYTLVDRKAHRLYNITGEQRRVLVIDDGRVTLKKPSPWRVRVSDAAVGKGMRRTRVALNGRWCWTVTTAPGLLPGVTRALMTYHDILARVQAQTYRATPPALQAPCDLAQYVFERHRLYRRGLILKAVYASGQRRRLVDYRTLPLRPDLFRLPGGYTVVNLKRLRGEAAAPAAGQ